MAQTATIAPDQLEVVDDVFGLQPGWVEAFADLSASNAASRLPFRCLMRADQVDPAVARALAAAGCRMVWMGAESGSQRILDAMEKGVARRADSRRGHRAPAAPASRSGSSCSSAIPAKVGRHRGDACARARVASPTTSACRCRIRCRARKFYERVRAELGREAELVRLRRSRDDVSRDLRTEFYRVLHHVVHHEFRARQRRAPRCGRSPAGRRVCAARRPASASPPGSTTAPRCRSLADGCSDWRASARRTLTPMSNGRSRRMRADASPRVVLYNPRAVFYTMPLALSRSPRRSIGRDVDVVIIDGRLEADPIGRVVAAAEGALCVGVTVLTGAPIHDALAVSRAVKAAHPDCRSSGAAGIRRCLPASASTSRAVDVGVIGQGEDTFREIVERLSRDESRRGCPGTVVRAVARSSRSTAPAARPQRLPRRTTTR